MTDFNKLYTSVFVHSYQLDTLRQARKGENAYFTENRRGAPLVTCICIDKSPSVRLYDRRRDVTPW